MPLLEPLPLKLDFELKVGPMGGCHLAATHRPLSDAPAGQGKRKILCLPGEHAKLSVPKKIEIINS